ncbi:hypothetical protein [Bosea beijingensis]
MITKRFKEARGIDEDTPFYGFYARVSGESRELLRQAQRKATAQLRGQPSNAVLLDELLRRYLAEGAS